MQVGSGHHASGGAYDADDDSDEHAKLILETGGARGAVGVQVSEAGVLGRKAPMKQWQMVILMSYMVGLVLFCCTSG